MLEVDRLASGYGQIEVVSDCSLKVGSGEIVGILGHNGMGKTTLLRTLMGHIPATRGRVVFNGTDITALPVHRRARLGLSLVPQGREIFPNLTARENIRMGLFRRGGDEAAAIDRIVAELPRLEPMLDRPGGMLSGGEQQILSIARCLATSPGLILLDEPTEGIQPSIIDELVEILLRLRVSRQLTILLVEQNLDFISSLADRALIIQKGRIIGEAGQDELASGQIVANLIGMDQ